MTTKAKPKPPFTVTTQVALAAFLGVDRGTVVRWADKGMPGGRAGPWNLSQVVKWTFCFGGWRSEAARDDLLRESIDGTTID